MEIKWEKLSKMTSRSFTCGYCDSNISSQEGYVSSYNTNGSIYICHYCGCPTYFPSGSAQVPGVKYGITVNDISSEDVLRLYEEVRDCMSVGSYTAAVLCCRKLLMNIAVSKGAKEGEKFIKYVEYLSDKGYVPPDGKLWVDKIRTKGNEATHEINMMNEEDAMLLIDFIGMIMKFIYEFPAMLNNIK